MVDGTPDNFESNLEARKEQLKLDKQIADAQKSQVKNISSLASYSGKILANYNDIRKMNNAIKANEKEINKLAKSTSEEDKKRLAQLKQANEELKKEKTQLQGINKSMMSAGVVMRGVFGSIGSILESVLGLIVQSITKFLNFDQKARDVAASMGLGASGMNLMRQNVLGASMNMQKYGVSVEDALGAQQAYSEELGRTVILGQSALINMAKIGKATGLGMQGMAQLTAEMEAFGLGANQASEFIWNMSSEASAMGLNSGKIIKKFQENLGLMNKLNFKAGLSGLKEMAKMSEKFKLSMQSVAAVADKVFRVEGAVEAAAQLQVLGGSLSALGDPFQLMYKARNAPEELTKQLAKAASASATFNAKTGEFEVSAYELDRLKEAAQALGLSYEELAGSAKQTAKLTKVEGLLGGKFGEDDMDLIASLSEFTKGGGAQINLGVGKDGKAMLKDLRSLSVSELAAFKERRRSAEEAAQQATGMREQWENFVNQVMMSTWPLLEALMTELKPLTDMLATTMTGWMKNLSFKIKDWGAFLIDGAKYLKENLGNWIKDFQKNWQEFQKNLKAVFAYIENNWKMMLLGVGVAWGLFNYAKLRIAGATQGGAAGKVIAKDMVTAGNIVAARISSAMAGGKGGAATSMLTGGQGGAAPTTPSTGDMKKTTSGMSKMGGVASISAGQILAFGAALLMVGAAIYIASKGFSELAASFALLTGPQAFGAVAGMLVVMGGFVAMLYLFPPIITEIGVAGTAGSLGLLALGAAFLMIGGGIGIAAYGISLLVDSFANLFKVIGENGAGLFQAGLGFGAMAAGMGILAFALMGLSAAAILGVLGLGLVVAATTTMVSAATALNAVGGADGLERSVKAINDVDQRKLDALKGLSMWMALLGGETKVVFDDNLKVSGEIKVKGEGTLSDMGQKLLSDPTFMSNLKKAIVDRSYADNNGGKRGASNKAVGA